MPRSAAAPAVIGRYTDTPQGLAGVTVAHRPKDDWLWMPTGHDTFAVAADGRVAVVDAGQLLLDDDPTNATLVVSHRLRGLLRLDPWDPPADAQIDPVTEIVVSCTRGDARFAFDIVTTDADAVAAVIDGACARVPSDASIKNGIAYVDRIPPRDGEPASVTAHHEISLAGRFIADVSAPPLTSIKDAIAWARQRATRIRARHDAEHDDYTDIPDN